MTVSFYKRGEYAWVQDIRGDFVCIFKGELRATVLSNGWQPWQVILHTDHGPALVRCEYHEDPQGAMARAEEFLSGTASGASIRKLPIGLLDMHR
jgi:hypothetical protein